jgi:WD40 repeat protein/uncharacterized caspase-like protein
MSTRKILSLVWLSKGEIVIVKRRIKYLPKFVMCFLIGWFFLFVFETITTLSITHAAEVPEIVPQTGHSGFVNDVKLSPDGKYLATASGDSTVKLWDVRTGQLIKTITAHTSEVFDLAFSNDGLYLATASKDTTAIIWSLPSLRQVHILMGHYGDLTKIEDTGWIHAVSFSPDNRLLATGAWDKKVIIWDVKSGKPLQTLKVDGGVTSIAFSPNGDYLASGTWAGHNKVIVWKISTWQKILTLEGHLGEITSLSFSPDSKLLASGSKDGTFHVWSMKEGISLYEKTFGRLNDVYIAFHPDGKSMATGSSEGVKFWQVGSWKEVHFVEPTKARIKKMSFSKNGQWIAGVGADNHSSWYIWNLSTGHKHPKNFAEISPLRALALSRDNRWIATSSLENKITVWDLSSGLVRKKLDGHSRAVASLSFSPAGPWLASGDEAGMVHFWDTSTGGYLCSLPQLSGRVNSLAFNANGGRLITGSTGDTVQLWDVDTLKQLWFYKPNPVVSPHLLVGYDNGGHWMFAGGLFFPTTVWDVKTGRRILPFGDKFGATISSMAISSDGEKAASSRGVSGDIELWKPSSGESLFRLSNHKDSINVIAFSPNNTLVVSAGKDKKINIWNVIKQTLIRSLISHTGDIEAITFTQKGNGLISASADGTARFWDASAGELRAVLVSLNDTADWLIFTSEGFFDGTRRAWKLVPFRFPSEPLKLYEPEQFFNQFYQPGLLTDIFREGKSIREILKDRKDPRAKLDIAAYRNSKLPEVKIANPKDGFKTGEREIRVTVEAKDPGSGLRDLRVFRNQNLVHFEHKDLIPDTQTKTFRLTVPVKLVAGVNEISAYTFNHDNLKSKDASVKVTGADSLKRKGTAYVLAVGINQYSNTDWNLNFAVNDATGITETLDQSFKKLNTYAQTVTVNLLNGAASRANLLTAFDLLSGAITSLPSGAPNELKKLRRAEPEDDIIVYFSGHGMADQDRYYLIPHDMGYQGRRVNLDKAGREIIMKHSLSDQDLNKGFEKIDAGRMMLIIDACQSGQALESEEKRRGPMNSRGLAQLAYEKGMYILAAAQSFQAALELEKLGHGILTYTLLEEGLKKLGADKSPKDGQVTAEEWLDYATQHAGREMEGARTQYAKKKGGEQIDGGEVTVTGQSPRAYYRRERVGDEWVIGK